MENSSKSMENLKKMIEPQNMVRMLPLWIAVGSKEIVEQSLEKANLVVEGP